MTIETNDASDQQQQTETTTSQDGQQDTTQISTDPSAQSQQDQGQDQTTERTAEQVAADAAAAAAAEDATAEGTDKAEGAAADPFAFADDDEGKKLKEFVGEKTPAQVAKELMNAQALLGKKAIGIPGKDSTPEEQRAFHKARGVPEDAAGYNLTEALDDLKKTAPEGWAPSEAMDTAFRQAARLSNMSNGEASEFARHFLGAQFEQRKEFVAKEVQATKDASALLAADWGPDRSVGDANFARGMKAIGLPAEGVDVFLAAYGGDGKARFGMVKAVAEIGRRQLEGGPMPGHGDGSGQGSMTKEQAAAEESRIMNDPELSKIFNDVNHPRHREISNEMGRLGKIKRGL